MKEEVSTLLEGRVLETREKKNVIFEQFAYSNLKKKMNKQNLND
jgi:hypothetical protein